MHGPAIPITIIIIAAVTGIIVIHWMLQIQRNKKKKYSKSHWMGVGIVIGMATGMPFGLLTGILLKNMAMGIALGPAFGVGIGIAVGAGLKTKFQYNTRKMTQKEKHIQKRLIVAGVILFALFVLILIRRLFF
jgi:uncharacterized membrane protein